MKIFRLASIRFANAILFDKYNYYYYYYLLLHYNAHIYWTRHVTVICRACVADSPGNCCSVQLNGRANSCDSVKWLRSVLRYSDISVPLRMNRFNPFWCPGKCACHRSSCAKVASQFDASIRRNNRKQIEVNILFYVSHVTYCIQIFWWIHRRSIVYRKYSNFSKGGEW